jgi:hypothetical protein
VPPELHTAFVARALPRLADDLRILAVAAGGSWGTPAMDEYSDIDLIVAVEPAQLAVVVRDAAVIAAALGPLLVSFPGDHLGSPHLLIGLYGPPLLHVDFKFLSVVEAAREIGKSSVLWEREGALTRVLPATPPVGSPPPDLQWIEDRVWVWLHYGATKAARGEVFEAIDALAYIRARVLGPLVLAMHNRPPHGVRRVEAVAGADMPLLLATLTGHDARGCLGGLRAAADLYRRLRESYAPATLIRRTAAEDAAVTYVETLRRALA